jgi:hypothetical protein
MNIVLFMNAFLERHVLHCGTTCYTSIHMTNRTDIYVCVQICIYAFYITESDEHIMRRCLTCSTYISETTERLSSLF